jgi:hypothetical protein
MVPPSTNHGTEDGKEKAATTVQAPPAEPVTPIHLPPKPVAPEETKIPPREVFSMPVVSEGPNEVILGLFLDVVSVQLTPDLRMGAIRAKPSSTEVSLDVVSAAMRATLPANGFQLGPVGVDGKGRIATIRLIPTLVPFKAGQTRNSLQIGGVSVVPIDSTERVQLTPAPGAPMTMQLLAHLELAGVELSSSFQVSQLVLKNRGNKVRVTLNSHGAGQEETGATCEILSVRLDHSGKIVELLLNPIR